MPAQEPPTVVTIYRAAPRRYHARKQDGTDITDGMHEPFWSHDAACFAENLTYFGYAVQWDAALLREWGSQVNTDRPVNDGRKAQLCHTKNDGACFVPTMAV